MQFWASAATGSFYFNPIYELVIIFYDIIDDVMSLCGYNFIFQSHKIVRFQVPEKSRDAYI